MTRTELINYFINQRNYKRYLEIGVNNEQHNFAHIFCDHKVGVDPNPVTSFCGSSDDYFTGNQEIFDIIFIDGLHTEDQVSKDISNALRFLEAEGVIVLHDCMPPDAWHQREPDEFQEGENWNGTVWKAVLRKFNHSDYKCILLDIDWGCGIIDTSQSQSPLHRVLPVQLNYGQHYGWLLEYSTSIEEYFREQVALFYHLACMGNWQDVFCEQMLQLQQNGFREINLTILGTEEDLQKVNSICDQFNLKIQLLFRNPDLSYYERPAMMAIEAYALENKGYVLYLHSKGVSNHFSETKIKWRQLMMNMLIDNWRSCMLKLPYYDIIGVNWQDINHHFSGNFWYASIKYLRKLADFKQYYDNFRIEIPDPFDAKRLACEFWIGTSGEIQHMLSLVCRNMDFYFCIDDFWESSPVYSTYPSE